MAAVKLSNIELEAKNANRLNTQSWKTYKSNINALSCIGFKEDTSDVIDYLNNPHELYEQLQQQNFTIGKIGNVFKSLKFCAEIIVNLMGMKDVITPESLDLLKNYKTKLVKKQEVEVERESTGCESTTELEEDEESDSVVTAIDNQDVIERITTHCANNAEKDKRLWNHIGKLEKDLAQLWTQLDENKEEVEFLRDLVKELLGTTTNPDVHAKIYDRIFAKLYPKK